MSGRSVVAMAAVSLGIAAYTLLRECSDTPLMQCTSNDGFAQAICLALMAVAAAVADYARLGGRADALESLRRKLASHVLYDRVSSNNSSRIRLWLHLRGLTDAISIKTVTHQEQLTEEFRRINPFAKIPAMIIDHGGVGNGGNESSTQWLAESAVILEYLEVLYQAELGGSQEGVQALLPSSPALRAHCNLVIRTHDLYLASPNCTQPGPFTHTQGCFYVPPPASVHATSRWIGKAERAAKLAECWKQLDVLEALLHGPFFCGGGVTLCDLAVYPTIVFFHFFAPRVYDWHPTAVFHGRPKLARWFDEWMPSLGPYVSQVREELERAQQAKGPAILDEIRAETVDASFKWVYP